MYVCVHVYVSVFCSVCVCVCYCVHVCERENEREDGDRRMRRVEYLASHFGGGHCNIISFLFILSVLSGNWGWGEVSDFDDDDMLSVQKLLRSLYHYMVFFWVFWYHI